ncbi:hypothetical protein M9434_005260 [Picochlorum sp. BPE23]|nr:hypothetical protein M9434_005260 [Picochlorum sp. BPE23]KAI8101408.1 hypothetical protein M9435_001514 [Picochlorum sp. BPE23]
MASVVVIVAGLVCGYLVVALLRALYYHHVTSRRHLSSTRQKSASTDLRLTLEELSKYNGMDPCRPLSVAVRGHVYDVSQGVEFYGPGKAYSVYAGREISRALAMMSLNEEDCNDNISSLSEKEKEVLAQWEKKFSQKYPKIGTVVPSMDLRVDELAAYDGRDPSKPMLLAIRGVIFDVSSAKEFYGPTGAYPFAGKECARALAKYSVEMDDCSDLLDDCSVSEMDALRSWEAQFHSKYKVVGHVMIS